MKKRMSTKVKVILYAILSGVTGYMAYFIALPPELQTGILGQLISLCSPSWQPAAASTSKTISVLLGIYATYKAAHNNQPPPSPPSPKP